MEYCFKILCAHTHVYSQVNTKIHWTIYMILYIVIQWAIRIILQARLQQYVNCKLSDVQARFRKGRGTRDQIANIHWIIIKAREFQKNIYFCFIDYAKAFDCVDHNKLENSYRDGNTDHLTCLLRNLYAGQEATVRTGHGTIDWFKIGKGVCQGCISSLCLFNLYAQYIMWNAGLESRLLWEISIISGMQMIPPLRQKVKRDQGASWWKWKRRVKKLT